MSFAMKLFIHALLGTILLVPSFSCSKSDSSLRVLAASSLTETFEKIASEFEKDTGIQVTLSFAGSSSLAAQIEDGAPADVIALADEETLIRVKQSGRLTQHEETIFATNYLAIATPIGNPASIRSISDFKGNIIAVCSEQVPCGRLAIELASFLKTEIEVSTWEPNVRSVRTKVELGEVDAGLIYITDGTNRVEITSVKGSERVKTKYPIVVVDDAKPSAIDFVDYVLSHEGQETLTQFRFGTP